MRKYFQAPWSTKELGTVILIVVAFMLIAITAAEIFDLQTTFKESEHKIAIFSISFMIQWLVIFGAIKLIGKKHKSLKGKDYGIIHIGTWPTIKSIIGALLSYIGITIIIATFIIYTEIKIPGYQVQEKILPLFEDKALNLSILAIIIILIAPILEELFFRGYILRTLVNKIGIYGGSVISAGIFAVFHMQWASIIPIFIIGLIINGAVIRTKSIIPAIGIHMTVNGIYFLSEVFLMKEIISLETIV